MKNPSPASQGPISTDTPPGRKADPDRLRPMERVVHYLLEEAGRAGWKDGGQLPTNRELAENLKVSIPTVNTAIARLVKQGRVRTRKGSGKYFVAQKPEAPQPRRIGVSSLLTGGGFSDPWENAIGGGMFHAALETPAPITLIGLSSVPLPELPEGQPEESNFRRLMAMRDQVCGLILFPYSLKRSYREKLVASFESAGKPVVYLNPDRTFGGANFVSPDYHTAGSRLGRALRETGRKRIAVMLGDPENSVSSQLWHAGLCHGLGSTLGDGITLLTREKLLHDEEVAHRVFAEMLTKEKAKGAKIDAVFCLSDISAMGVCRAALEAGLKIPADLSVIGGSGVDLTGRIFPHLTRIHPSFQQWGRALVELLLHRLDTKNLDYPGIILPAPFIGGGSTTARENRLLEIPPSPFVPETAQ